jgi:hypothetical protein
MRMTAEHCNKLGEKFANLAVSEGGGDPAIRPEANKVGRDFAEKCKRDMAGKVVPKSEYECMLRVKASSDLLGCK